MILVITVPFLVKAALDLIRSGVVDQDCKHKIMVIYAMQDNPMFGTFKQGFMSELQNAVGAIAYGLENEARGLRIDFRNPIYTDAHQADGNYWSYFFESTIAFSQDLAPQSHWYHKVSATTGGYWAHYAPNFTGEETHYNRHVARFGQLGSFARILNGPRPRNWPYPLPLDKQTCDSGECGLSVEQASQIMKKHVHLKPEIQTKIDQYVQTQFEGKWVIGVHYRGTDKVMLWPYAVPSYEALGEEIDRIRANYISRETAAGRVAKPVWVYMATDEKEARNWVAAKYPGRVLTWAGSARILVSKGDAMAQLLGSHKTASGATAFQKGESVVMDTFLLGRTQHLIKNKSSVSDVAMQLLDEDAGCTFLLTDDLSWEFRASEPRSIAYPLKAPDNMRLFEAKAEQRRVKVQKFIYEERST